VDGADWADDEPFEARPPLPPEDRLWRHPSELGPAPVAAGPAASTLVAPTGPRWGRMTGLFVVATAGAVLVAFAFHLTFRPGPSGSQSAGVSAVPAAVTATVSTVIAAPAGRAWLGITGADIDGVATVGEVKAGSPALAAGLQVDDQVVAVDGRPVGGMAELVAAIGRYGPGEACVLTVVRAGGLVDIAVVLGGNT
jgi:membrane-associated protease RseP (regulator of RpoE activity)